jgi:hypothetical protein
MTRKVKKTAPLTPISDKKRVPVAVDEKPKFRLHVDANRDGSIDDDPNGLDTWAPGKGKKGAVLLVNNNGTPALIDHDDDKVNGAADVADLTPLDIRRTGPTPPAGYKVVLSVSADDAKHIRIFDVRTAGGKEIVGPTKGEKYELPDLSQAKLELGMEAIRYAGKYSGKDFSGDVMVTLTTLDGATEVDKHQAKFRVAPWIMFNHFDTPEKVYVLTTVGAGIDNNAAFVAALAAATSAAGATLERIDGARFGDDRWMQDIMEFGYSEAPKRGVLRNVMETPRGRGLAGMPKTLASGTLGYLLPAPAPGAPSSLNSGGNLECTPPFTTKKGKSFPFGRMYYCRRREDDTSDGLPGEYVAFLQAQKIQNPIEIDAGWLNVGHVDEFISFVPCGGAKGFKLLLASPNLGMKLVKDAASAGAKMLIGKGYGGIAAPGAEISAADLLSRGVDYGTHVMTGSQLETYNVNCQRKIDAGRKKLVDALGLDSSDIAEVPILYVAEAFGAGVFGRADALTAGMVNMLVLDKHCIAPKPFGPVVSGIDTFEASFRATLTACGLAVTFIDDWETYHRLLGEVHCGTNTLRIPKTSTKWWELVP